MQQRITAGETPSLQSLFYYLCLLCNYLDESSEKVFYVGGRGRLFFPSLLVLLLEPRQRSLDVFNAAFNLCDVVGHLFRRIPETVPSKQSSYGVFSLLGIDPFMYLMYLVQRVYNSSAFLSTPILSQSVSAIGSRMTLRQ